MASPASGADLCLGLASGDGAVEAVLVDAAGAVVSAGHGGPDDALNVLNAALGSVEREASGE